VADPRRHLSVVARLSTIGAPHRRLCRGAQRAIVGIQERALPPDRCDEAFGWYLGAHSLTAAISILAEAQRFLGAAEIVTERPLRPVLDRRPFI
jgi:hypothetical protein